MRLGEYKPKSIVQGLAKRPYANTPQKLVGTPSKIRQHVHGMV